MLQNILIMKLLFLFVVTLSLCAESKSLPQGQDGKKEDLFMQCLFEVLTKAVSKPDGTSLQPECKDILQKQDSSHSLLMIKNGEEKKGDEAQESKSNARAQELIKELLKTNEEKRDDMDEERSQEEFPNYYKRHNFLTSKEKREYPDYERSQEEFPQKRHSLLYRKEKREYQDEERSQEEFPIYEQKRHLFFTSKEKRDEPDYDRSQEDFPSYMYKRYHDEDGGTEKQFLKPHKYHNKFYDDSSNEDFVELNSKEKRFEEEDSAKPYWNPISPYHYKKHYRHDGESSNEEMGSEEKHKRVLWTKGSEERTEENEEKDKRFWKPFHKQSQFENENEAKLHHSLEASKRRSPEEEEEELIAQELNENNHHYESQEEQKRHHSDAVGKNQEREAELRYLTKKRNELEERLLKDGEAYEKRNPWIYRGYYQPAWYKRSAEGNIGSVGPSQKLEELANALRYKTGLLSEKVSTEGEKAYLHQRALTPEELKDLEKLASVEQRAQIN